MKKGMKILMIVMLVSFTIAFLWDKLSFIKQGVHAILDPSAGSMLAWNLNLGMLILVFIISLTISLAQKYLTDQASLKELKKQQKVLQQEMRKYKNDPSKLMEFQKKQLEFLPKTCDLTMKPLIFTAIPIILFFRWFNDYFIATGNPKILGFFTWFWFYLVFSIIFNIILKKIMKIA